MKNYRIFIIAAAALALGACQEKESLAPQKQAIRFTTNLGAYTKATDTSFEEGDAVSLFAEAPINALNVKMVCSGGELIPETPVYWKEDQPAGQYTSFFAVYPYREDWEDLSDLSVFSVNADQRTHEQYTASDLLGASYMAYPDCETVPLNFTHRLSKLSLDINLDEDLKGAGVSDVYIKNAYGKVRLGLFYGMNVSTVGQRGTIRMGQHSRYSDSWCAIVPPQQSDFTMVVVLDNGNMYEIQAGQGYQVYMESAKAYTAYVYINQQTATVSNSFAVEQWTPDNDAAFGQYIADEFHSEGWWYIMDANTNEYYGMTYNAYQEDHFEVGLSVSAGSMYQLVYENGRRELFFGLGETAAASVGSEYPLKENGTSFGFNSSGDVVVSVYPYRNMVSFTPDDEVWSVVGEFGEDPWNTDIDMTRESSGVYSIEFESHGEEFKFRANHSWDKNLGCPYQLWGGTRYYMYYGGSNIKIAEAGRYHLTIDTRNCIVTTVLLESYYTEDLYQSFMGNWVYQDDDSSYIWNINGSGFPYYNIQFEDFYMTATLDQATAKIPVRFQRLGEWTWGDYGLVYDYFLTHSQNRNFFLQEDDSVVAFYLEKDADGNILVSPGSYDSEIFDSVEFIIILQEGDYAGAYARYGLSFPLPMIWTPAN